MKIGIISDTHNNIEGIKQAWKIFEECQVKTLIHCGDWTKVSTLEFIEDLNYHSKFSIRGVLGNNDEQIAFYINKHKKEGINISDDKVLKMNLDGKNVAIFHGDNKIVLKSLIRSKEYDAIFTGHTHKISKEYAGKTMIFNPGAVGSSFPGRCRRNLSVGIYDSQTNSAESIIFDMV